MIRKIILANSLIAASLAAALLVYPSVRAGLDLQDPALKKPGIPKVDWRLMRHLSPRYAAWAQERVALGRAESLSTNDISGTEWPLFGSVFYLWAIENLQAAWEAGDHTAAVEPKVFCKDAIIAASDLVIDPKHASWVEKHWGTNYLHRENVFYRMLVMAALTSREKLLHDGAHLDLLRDQVETFSKELNDSKSGLLNDYPGECYPVDVMAAIACIRRADAVLGTDHSAFISRSLRAFIGPRTTRLKLPPYMAEAETGAPFSEARGCATVLFLFGVTGTVARSRQNMVSTLREILLAGAARFRRLPRVSQRRSENRLDPRRGRRPRYCRIRRGCRCLWGWRGSQKRTVRPGLPIIERDVGHGLGTAERDAGRAAPSLQFE